LFLLVFAAGLLLAIRKVGPVYEERSRLTAELSGRLTECVGGIRVVKAYHAEASEAGVFAAGLRRLFQNALRQQAITSFLLFAATMLMGLVGATVMYIGAIEVFAGRLSSGGLITFLAFLAFLIVPVLQVVTVGREVAEATAGFRRIQELLSLPQEEHDLARSRHIGPMAGHVLFDDVSFSYASGARVLHGITFEAAPGTLTALVGPSGAGKSTLVGLLSAFYSPDSGAIYIDGADLAKVRLEAYRTQIGVVLQDTFLFDGTIKENVCFAKPGAGEDEFLHACRVAYVDEFASRLEHGYETVIGERGVKLSGGQRQRISIARAILASPRLLILDEATSNLDSESEAMIRDAIGYLVRGRTTFIVTHRLSTVHNADQILVIEGGRIVERGTHASLRVQRGRYNDLYRRQRGIGNSLRGAPEGGETSLVLR
jgi:subfamily B ATP-binding cassette protein MsbA